MHNNIRYSRHSLVPYNTNMQMNDFIILGECLIELSWDQEGRAQQGFAGDVYSVAVYLKRSNPQVRVRLLCAIGNDPLSEALSDSLEAEGVETSLMLQHPDRHAGLYAIHNDAQGERSFIYWRSESAARHTLNLLDADPEQAFAEAPSCFYLTGISLAILDDSCRDRLWPLLEHLRARGTRIVFDTNYRPRLWPDRASAIEAFEKTLRLSDLVLPGVEDMELLYGLSSTEEIGAHLHSLGVKEMVLKDGPADIFFGPPRSPQRHEVNPVEKVVDTTAAGDSFSGTLLGGLARGLTLADAIPEAAAMSARVIQHRGAVLPRSS